MGEMMKATAALATSPARAMPQWKNRNWGRKEGLPVMPSMKAAALMVLASLWLPRGGVDAPAYSVAAASPDLEPVGIDEAEPASA